jgi:hypothetical protein
MEKFITDFVVEHFKNNTSKKKQITNQNLDELLQLSLGVTPFSDAGIRGLIHYIRVHITIENEQGEKGWICGTIDGYYLSYNAVDILTHLNQFEGKIRKMMVVHKKGMSMLVDKIYYKQQELKFNNNEMN